MLRFIADSGSIRTVTRAFVAPIAVEGGPGIALYVADEDAIFRLAPGERRPQRVGEATVPAALAVDGDGNVYVSEPGGEKRVLRIAPDGGTSLLSP